MDQNVNPMENLAYQFFAADTEHGGLLAPKGLPGESRLRENCRSSNLRAEVAEQALSPLPTWLLDADVDLQRHSYSYCFV